MGFASLLEVASMPILQVILISLLGSFMATDYLNLPPSHSRRSLNKIVFVVFAPALMFSNLAETVTFKELVAWWFMPVNVGLTFLFGGILGWIAVKILKPEPHLEGLIIATCSSGNLGPLILIIVPAICSEDASPFGTHEEGCSSIGLSYGSFSMALGGLYIWTYSYQLMRSSSLKYKALQATEEISRLPNKDLLGTIENTNLLKDKDEENQSIVPQASTSFKENVDVPLSGDAMVILHKLVEELFSPPTVGSILGFVFGAIPFLKNLIIGGNAPLRVVQDSAKVLGDGAIPCMILILGGSLIRGLRSVKIKSTTIVAVICVRFVLLPMIGIVVVKTASSLGLLPPDPLFHFVMMVQFAVPPAMYISTMCELFDVAQEESSVLYLWTYVAAAFALTIGPPSSYRSCHEIQRDMIPYTFKSFDINFPNR